MVTALNIVVVEDNDALREITVDALCEMGHRVVGVACAEALADEASGKPVDLMVIDLNLPGEDGISLARRMRAAQPDLGIVMVTSRGQIEQKLQGYDSGADIYLAKPVPMAELAAAVQALGRRLKRQRSLPEGDFSLKQIGLSLHGPQTPPEGLSLSALEFATLAALVRAPGQRLDYWQLTELAGKTGIDIKRNALEVQMVRLRKKLLQAGAPQPNIKTVRGVGYQLCVRLSVI